MKRKKPRKNKPAKEKICVMTKTDTEWFKPSCTDIHSDLLVCGLTNRIHDYCPCCGGKTILKEEL